LKHDRRPNRRQMRAISAAGLLPSEWYVIKNLAGELHIKNKFTDKIKVIPA
jgi:hypothetical protein